MTTVQVIAAWLLKNMSILRLLGRLAKALILGERINLPEELNNELEAIRAETDARVDQIKNGTQAALDLVELKHQEQLEQLRETQKERADELSKDPAKLAGAAVRAARAARLARERAGG